MTALYSLFLNQPAFEENKLSSFKIHLFSILNTKQTNDGIFRTRLEKLLIWQKLFETESPTLSYLTNPTQIIKTGATFSV